MIRFVSASSSRGFAMRALSGPVDQSAPDASTLALFGEVNFTWAQLDLIVSGALATLLKIDPAELALILGRLESKDKIARMHSIVRHRRDKKLSSLLADLKKEVTCMRPLRNAITHGVYIGKTDAGEVLFKLPADFILDDNQETAHQLFVCTIDELQQHIMYTTRVAVILRTEFDSEDMRRLFQLPVRARPNMEGQRGRDKAPRTHPARPRPSRR
jgi:hypothetical protein